MPVLAARLAALLLRGVSVRRGGGSLLPFARCGCRRPPRVDGVLDDAAWRAAPRRLRLPPARPARRRARHARRPRCGSSTTTTRSTSASSPATASRRRSSAAILERDKVMTQGLDNAAKFTGDDVVAFTLDPFHDHRNAFFFATNPNGAEFDALVTDESPTLNVDWRAVWRVAARRVPEGWSAEFAIPFRSLRYPRGEGEQVWGFDVERIVRRRNEDTLWSAWTRAEGGLNRVSRAGHLAGLGGLPAHGRERRAAAVRPRRPDPRAGRRRRRPRDDRVARAGADLKWEVTARPRPRRDGAARLRPGRGRRPDREPDALRGRSSPRSATSSSRTRGSSTSARAAPTRRLPS